MGPIRAPFWLPSAPLASWTHRNWRKTDHASGIGPIPRSKMAIFLSYGLGRAGIRVFLLKGNHDAESVITRAISLSEGVFQFPATKTIDLSY
jgi:hypothetical protein